MALTSIGQQKTPGRPIEITFAPDLGVPSDLQEVLLIGHAQVGAAASGLNVVRTISNVQDPDAALTEMIAKGYTEASEITKMVLAAINANAGGSSFPALKIVAMASTETGFGTSDAALTAAKKVKAEFLVSPYASSDQDLTTKLKNAALAMSGAANVDNNQFGTFGVAFERAEDDPAELFKYDTQYLFLPYLRDSGSPTYSIAEMAAACAAVAAANGIPFNPLDDETIQNVEAPAALSDYLTIGGGAESETALNQGYTPLKVKPNGEVAFVRVVTARISADGSGAPVVGSYYDLPDFQVLYYWRKTLWTRVSQPDFKQRKASADAATDLKGEVIRLMKVFESNSMFQAVDKLAPSVIVQRSESDRHRFDVLVPVNVIPGLHVVAQNIKATTEFDGLTV